MSDSDFSEEKQKLLIEHMLCEEQIYQRAANIIDPTYFDKALQPSMKYIMEHAEEFTALPTFKQIEVETGMKFEKIDILRENDVEWALDNLEKFCKRQAIVQAVWKSPEYIEDGNYGKVEAMVKEALEISLQKDLGIDYFHDPKERLKAMLLNTLVPTGWEELDRNLYGGLNRGEITIFAGASGAGKSLFLQNIALNWVYGTSYEYNGRVTKFDPMNVVYISLELSEQLIAKRIDTMVTGIDTRDIFRRMDEVEMKVVMSGKKAGNFRIKQMPQGATAADIRAYLKEYEIQLGQKVDAICVDYLDLMHPGSIKVSASDMFIKDKYVTEELRGLAVELDILCITASQLNRSAIDESDHSQNMIAGGISKINTADNVLSIITSPAMRERGEYAAQFLKTRSSAGVGRKIYLSFDITSLRIGNLADGHAMIQDENSPSLRDTASSSSSNNILNQIKRSPVKNNTTTVVNGNNVIVHDSDTGEVIDETPITDTLAIKENAKPQSLSDRLKNMQKAGKL